MAKPRIETIRASVLEELRVLLPHTAKADELAPDAQAPLSSLLPMLQAFFRSAGFPGTVDEAHIDKYATHVRQLHQVVIAGNTLESGNDTWVDVVASGSAARSLFLVDGGLFTVTSSIGGSVVERGPLTGPVEATATGIIGYTFAIGQGADGRVLAVVDDHEEGATLPRHLTLVDFTHLDVPPLGLVEDGAVTGNNVLPCAVTSGADGTISLLLASLKAVGTDVLLVRGSPGHWTTERVFQSETEWDAQCDFAGLSVLADGVVVIGIESAPNITHVDSPPATLVFLRKAPLP